MSAYPISVDEMVSWFASKASSLTKMGVTMAEIHTSTSYVPACRADFDTESRIGRVSIWATGEVDFEILRRSDGEYAYFRHESVLSIQAHELEKACDEFLQAMQEIAIP
jgi:hypothetical protein